MSVLWAALGGALGASARYGLSKALGGAANGFPWGTFTANIIGGFLMGLLAGALATKFAGAEPARLFLGVGVLGGFTTFSAFSLEAMMMIERKAYGLAAGYMAGSVVLSIFALFLGLAIARRVFAV